MRNNRAVISVAGASIVAAALVFVPETSRALTEDYGTYTEWKWDRPLWPDEHQHSGGELAQDPYEFEDITDRYAPDGVTHWNLEGGYSTEYHDDCEAHFGG